MKERTLVIIKPDAIVRGTAGEVFSRLEPLKLEVLAAKAARPSRELAEEHYRHLKGRPFFEALLDHMTGKLHGINYVLAFVFYGENAIARVREVTGATDPDKADPMTIRGALGRTRSNGLMENLLHASSTAADADREIGLWFSPGEILKPVEKE